MPRSTLPIAIALLISLVVIPTSDAAETDDESEPAVGMEDDESPEAAAMPDSCELRAVFGGVACEGEDGEEFWRTEHPSMWELSQDFQDRNDEVQSATVVSTGERHFYGYRSDLVEVDARPQVESEEGVWSGGLTRRWRFPAPIVDISVVDEQTLDIVVRVRIEYWLREDGEKFEEVTIRHFVDGQQPAQVAWSDRGDEFATQRDAAWILNDDIDEQDSAAIERLEKAYRLDRTNPYFPLELAVLYRDIGEEKASKKAFATAARTEGAPWQDLMRIATELETFDQSELADEAYDRAVAKMNEVGIFSERTWNLISMVFLFPSHRMVERENSPIDDAISEGDVDTVHRLSLRRAELFPNIEGGHTTWSFLADWMEEQGRDELAAQWRTRAEHNREINEVMMDGAARVIDRGLLAMTATFLGLILLCLLVGLRGGLARRRELDAAKGAGNDKSAYWWIPRLRLRDIVAPLVLFAILAGLPYYINTYVQALGAYAGAPISVSDDSLASPEVERWLDTLSQSPARDELAAISAAESQALADGTKLPAKGPTVELVSQAIMADAKGQQLEALRSGRIPDVTAVTEFEESDSAVEQSVASGLTAFLALFTFSVLVTLILVGGVLGNKLPRATRWGLRLVPGGISLIAPLGGFMLVALLAALLSFTGLDSILQSIATPSFGRYFAINNIEVAQFSPSRGWAWATIAIVFVIHAVTVSWDWRRQ